MARETTCVIDGDTFTGMCSVEIVNRSATVHVNYKGSRLSASAETLQEKAVARGLLVELVRADLGSGPVTMVQAA